MKLKSRRVVGSSLAMALLGGFLPNLVGAQAATPERGAILAARAKSIAATKADIEALIERYGGLEEISYELEPFVEEVSFVMEEQEESGDVRFYKGGHHFGRGITQLALLEEWSAGSSGEMALEAIIDFDRKLKALGIDLIVVPVPSKLEAYPRAFESEVPEGIPIAVARLTHTLKLLEADVEVVDLLPTLLETMTEDDAIPVYERSGHHISGIGVRAVAELIQKRLDRYRFTGRDAQRFTDVQRTGTERVNRNVAMECWEVLDRGETYEHVTDSELLVMGDSHAFAYGKASWTCQTARCAGIPITDISVSGGAATAHLRLASLGLDMLKKRRAVIWVMTSVAMSREWDRAEILQNPSIPGLLVAGAIDEAIAAFQASEGELTGLGVRETELDELGRRLINDPETQDQAIAILEINARVFPFSAVAHDSVGRACMSTGLNEKAIASFKQVLSLNPEESIRGNAVAALRQLGVEYEAPAKHRMTVAAMEALVGRYTLTSDNVGHVRIKDGALEFEFIGQPVVALEPLSNQRFTTTVGFVIEFVPGTGERGGDSMQVVLSGEGQTFKGRRVSKVPGS